MFVDAAVGDFNLQSGSPAIDAGTAFFEWNGVVLVDLGPGEYNGTAPDMGALESANSGGGENLAPTADAGPDQSVKRRSEVKLGGTNSFDPDGAIQGYQWRQISGKAVELKDADSDVASFRAPSVRKNRSLTLVFELTVLDDSGASGSDTVTVVVTGS